MLKELLALWHDDTPLADIFKHFDEMLVSSKRMFELSTSYLFDGEDSDKIHRELTKMDTRLNILQQHIRRDIVTHIAVQGRIADITPCLLLISLVKDAERIGDYCKNIDEIFRHSNSIAADPLFDDAVDMRGKILIWFKQTKRAFDRCDKTLAKSTREEAYLQEKECDRIIFSLAADNEGRNAVAIAMLIRFFKRVIAHMGNICTSVIMPFDKLDYFEKPGMPGQFVEDE